MRLIIENDEKLREVLREGINCKILEKDSDLILASIRFRDNLKTDTGSNFIKSLNNLYGSKELHTFYRGEGDMLLQHSLFRRLLNDLCVYKPAMKIFEDYNSVFSDAAIQFRAESRIVDLGLVAMILEHNTYSAILEVIHSKESPDNIFYKLRTN